MDECRTIFALHILCNCAAIGRVQQTHTSHADIYTTLQSTCTFAHWQNTMMQCNVWCHLQHTQRVRERERTVRVNQTVEMSDLDFLKGDRYLLASEKLLNNAKYAHFPAKTDRKGVNITISQLFFCSRKRAHGRAVHHVLNNIITVFVLLVLVWQFS